MEFAYNQSVHSATKKSSFEVAYGFKPLKPMDLLPLPRNKIECQDGAAKAELVKKLHAEVRENLEKRTEQYAKQANQHRKAVTFKPGDWVWLHLRPERFPQRRKDKLSPRGDGPFQVIERINDNAYRLELPGTYNTSTSFNVTDLVPFDVGDEGVVLRSEPSQGGGDDGTQPSGPHTDDSRDTGRDDSRDAGRDDSRDAGRDDSRDAGRDDGSGASTRGIQGTVHVPTFEPGAITRSRSATRKAQDRCNTFANKFMALYDPRSYNATGYDPRFEHEVVRSVFTITR